MAEQTTSAPFLARIPIILGITSLIYLFSDAVLVAITSSLWLDELLSAWTAAGPWRGVVEKASTHQGQSPLFYLIAGATYHFIPSELGLRLPSILASVLSLLLLATFLRRLKLSWLTVVYSMLAYLSLTHIDQTIHDARPYALALCALTSAALSALTYTSSRSILSLITFIISGALVCYFHFLYAAPLFFILLFFASRAGIIRTAISASCIAVLCAPIVNQVFLLSERATALSFVQNVTAEALFMAVIPIEIFLPLVSYFALSFLIFRVRLSITHKRVFILSACLWLLPPLFFWALSSSTNFDYFTPRYFNYYGIGLSIATGLLVTSLHFQTQLGQSVMLAFLCVFLIGASTLKDPFVHEDWKEASAQHTSVVDPMTPLVFFSGMIESSDLERIKAQDPFLLAPLAFYPFPASEVTPLPLDPFSEPSQSFLKGRRKELCTNQALGGLFLDNLTWNRAQEPLKPSQYYTKYFETCDFKVVEHKKFKRLTLVYFRKFRD